MGDVAACLVLAHRTQMSVLLDAKRTMLCRGGDRDLDADGGSFNQ